MPAVQEGAGEHLPLDLMKRRSVLTQLDVYASFSASEKTGAGLQGHSDHVCHHGAKLTVAWGVTVSGPPLAWLTVELIPHLLGSVLWLVPHGRKGQRAGDPVTGSARGHRVLSSSLSCLPPGLPHTVMPSPGCHAPPRASRPPRAVGGLSSVSRTPRGTLVQP